MKSHRIVVFTAAASLLFVHSPLVATAGNFNATASGGAWTTPSSWVENSGFPGSGDNVYQNQSGSTVSLTADAAANELHVYRGIVDLAGFNLSVTGRIDVGQDGSGGQLVRSVNSGTLTQSGSTIYISNGGVLNLLTGDSLANLAALGDSSAAVVNQNGNVTYSGQVGVDNGLTYNLGANTLSANRLDVGQGGGVGHFNRSAGSALNISANIFMQNSSLEVRSGDTIATLHDNNSSTVTQVGNLTYSGTVEVDNGSTYNLGANSFTANRLDIGQNGGTGTFNRSAGSQITVPNIYMQRSALEVRAGDTITGELRVDNNSSVTQTGNVSNASEYLNLQNGGSYALGANSLTVGRLDLGQSGGIGTLTRSAGSVLTAGNIYMQRSAVQLRTGDTIAGELRVDNNSSVTQAGNVSTPATNLNISNGGSYALGANSLSVSQLRLGVDGGTATFTRSAGSTITVGSVFVRSSNALQLGASDLVTNYLEFSNGSTGSTTVGGATVTGSTLDGGTLSINDTSTFTLGFNDPSVAGFEWAFRWLGNRESTLDSLISSGRIIVNESGLSAANQSLFGPDYTTYDGTYTYIGFNALAAAVPEPSSLALFGFGSLFMALVARRRRLAR